MMDWDSEHGSPAEGGGHEWWSRHVAGRGAIGQREGDRLFLARGPQLQPRVVWLMVPAGVVDGRSPPAPARRGGHPDGGNSYYVDDIRRAKELTPKGIHYVDVGTSGGVWGLNGATA
jgi:hypothetical protein